MIYIQCDLSYMNIISDGEINQSIHIKALIDTTKFLIVVDNLHGM